MPILDSKLDTRSEVFQQNKSDMLKMLEYLNELLEEASRGGGEEAIARLRSREKMPIRERISHALDRDSPFLEISPLAAWRSAYAIGSGFVVGIGVIENVECVILGHDPSVRAGAFNEFNSKKQDILNKMGIAIEKVIITDEPIQSIPVAYGIVEDLI